ncbi:hypothetical protein D9M69_714790 [compost metagenome]
MNRAEFSVFLSVVGNKYLQFSRHINARPDHLHKIHGHCMDRLYFLQVDDQIYRLRKSLPLAVMIGESALDTVGHGAFFPGCVSVP